MTNRMSLNLKLFLIVSINVATVLASVWAGYSSITALITAQSENDTMAHALRNHMSSDMMHDALKGDVLNALYNQSIKNNNPEVKKEVSSDLEEHIANFKENINNNKKLELDTDIKSLLSQVDTPLNEYIMSAQSIVSKTLEDDDTAAAELPHFIEAFKNLEDKMGELSDKISIVADEKNAIAIAAGPRGQKIMLFMLAVSLMLAVVSFVVLNKSVTKNLMSMIVELRDSSAQLLMSSAQMASASQALAERATEQAASLEETAASL
jgi:methyl-accepting chemotaxis protein